MKINELQQPQINPSVVSSTVARLKNLIQQAGQLPEDSPAKYLVSKLIQTLALGNSLAEATTASEQAIVQNIILALQANPEQLQALLKSAENAVAVAKQVAKAKPVQQAFASHKASIELDTKGEIVRMDKELEQYAKNIAKKLNLSLKWTRNLVGMFGMDINREDKIEFLKACDAGTALDLPRMMKAKTGKLEDFITKTPPTIQQVFNSIKGTLLDISLSSGQGAATGPFEAMLAIMGGAQKAPTGDLLIKGKKYEVKSSSVSVGAKGASNSNAWLDATGEIAPANVRKQFLAVVEAVNPRLAKHPKTSKADFRPRGLDNMSFVIEALGDKSIKVLTQLHSTMFPAVTKLREAGYNFPAAIKRIQTAIINQDAPTIAREQGIMAMLEYAAGKYQSGFILYNSSFQTFRIINSVKDIVAMEHNPEELSVNFESKTVTMGSGRKSSPGIYFGPLASSSEGKRYIATVRGSEDWQQKYQQGLDTRRQEAAEHGEEFVA
jgi:hypothetical protein